MRKTLFTTPLLALTLALTLCGVQEITGAQSASAQIAPPSMSTPGEDGENPPEGANDWKCTPSADKPHPLVLVHGSWNNQNQWNLWAPQLKEEGYCVFTLNYGRDTSSISGRQKGVYGTAPIEQSAAELGAFVDKVIKETGTPEVDVIAHSQGAPMSRYYMRFDDGASKVNTLVTLGGTNHGTTMNSFEGLTDSPLNKFSPMSTQNIENMLESMGSRILGPAAMQQRADSDFMKMLNKDGDTDPGVDYIVIATRFDQISLPPDATFLKQGRDSIVKNLWLQDEYPKDRTNHGDLVRSEDVLNLVITELNKGFN